MKNLLKNLFLVIGIFVVLSLVFSLFTSTKTQSSQPMALTDLARKIQSGEIKKIDVQDNALTVTDTSGKTWTSEKESESSLSQSLTNLGVDKTKLAAVDVEVSASSGGNTMWLTILIDVVAPFLMIVGLFWFMSRQAQKGMAQTFNFGRANLKLFANPKERTTFKDVAGAKEAKEELREIVDFLKHAKRFLDLGARIPRGVLLMGAPGTGKTLLARAIAGEAGVPFFHISGSEFVELFVGVGASRVRDLFTTAKKASPAIIFIDEIDAVGRQRGTGLGGGHDEREQTLNQILVEMDGFDRETNIIVVAATNRPDVLDPALLRPGRFDRRIVIDLPDVKEREEILQLHMANKKAAPDVNVHRVAQRTPGFAGADLANLVNEAALLAARKNKKTLDQGDLFSAMEKVILGPERKSHVLTQQEREITAYHEAGHALVAAMLPHADPVHKISIISRGRAAGYTLKLPVEDQHLYTKSHFLDELASLLGGYVAEQVVFHELTTGASNDLQHATELARSLVTEYGMSEKFGPVSFSAPSSMVFLGRDLGTERDYSEKVAQDIDAEVSSFLGDARKQAERIVTDKRAALDAIAARLIEHETIEKEEFETLIAQFANTKQKKQKSVRAPRKMSGQTDADSASPER